MQAVEYSELDIPVCSLTYGTLPCGARLPTANDPDAIGFDGATYLTRGTGLSGAADSKTLTFSLWIWLEAIAATEQVIFGAETSVAGATMRTRLSIDTSGKFCVLAYNAAGTLIHDNRSSVLPLQRWVHVAGGFDQLPSTARLYVDRVSDNHVTVNTNDTVDYTMAEWSVAAAANGTLPLIGRLAQLWFAPGTFLDIATVGNLNKFIATDRSPVDLGVAGATPTGSSPLVFLNATAAFFNANLGTGGNFNIHGTMTDADFATGEIKCFDTRATCQDPLRYVPDDVTLRFARPAEYLPAEIEAIPSIEEISFTPANVSLGKNLGTRATLQVAFRDHPHSDTGDGYDAYLADRDYDPFGQGSYWGKFRARQPYLRNLALRWKSGLVGDALADLDIRHFIVDSFDGPTPEGKFSLFAKDVLKLADGDRAQAPALSTGYLSADLTAIATSATLLPSGIGSEYAASGYLNIGGNEIVSFTRVVDVLTIVRGTTAVPIFGTVGSAHKAQDRVQTVLRYSGADVANIIYDLLVTYAEVPASYITLADWQAETAAFLGTLYTAVIAEPTSVKLLVEELIEQAALVIWDDNTAQALRLQVLRGVTTDAATFTPDNTLENSLTIKEQPDQRVSRVQVYFGQKDPTKPLSNTDNYRSVSLTKDAAAEEAYGSAAIRTIFSRWIPEAGRTIADRLGAVILGRFVNPPRRLSFATMRHASTDVAIGVGYRVEAYCVQDPTGAQDNIPIQVTRLNLAADRFVVEAEEMLWTAPAADLADRQIVFDANTSNINLRTAHDSIYPTPVAGDVVTFTINAGVVISSASSSLPSVNVGTWPAGVDLTLVVAGTIEAAGGLGGLGGGGGGAGTGSVGQAASAGAQGGTALYTRVAIDLELPAGAKLWSGGGGGGGGGGGAASYSGGGGGGGGGGAGVVAGLGAQPGHSYNDLASSGTAGNNGSSTAGGNSTAGGAGLFGGLGGASGTGGAPGSAGDAGAAGAAYAAHAGGAAGTGGAAGYAIDGSSFVTTTVAGGDQRGTLIN